jgi:hypothetical protein
MVGTTDMNKEYHPFGMMLTRFETQQEYAFMFRAVKNLAKRILDFDYKPTVLVADTAPLITLGFQDVFNLIKRGGAGGGGGGGMPPGPPSGGLPTTSTEISVKSLTITYNATIYFCYSECSGSSHLSFSNLAFLMVLGFNLMQL